MTIKDMPEKAGNQSIVVPFELTHRSEHHGDIVGDDEWTSVASCDEERSV